MEIRRTLLVAVVISVCISPFATATQIVTLDFDTYTTTGSPDFEHEYTAPERAEIKILLEEMFLSDPGDPLGGPFGIKFEILDPSSPPPPFTTSLVKFNKGFMGGVAEQIDFRNLDDADDVDINAIDLLESYDGTAKAPELGGGTWSLAELTSSPAIIQASANLAGHELGHVFGARHHDAFGPAGTGIGVSPAFYLPTYPGPSFIGNTSLHVMGLASSVSLNANTLLTPSWINERTALKLAINAAEDELGPNPYLTDESEFGGDASDFGGTASPIALLPIGVPNTTRPPDPVGIDPGTGIGGPPILGAFAAIVTATIEPRDPTKEAEDVDWFTFEGVAGAMVTVEIISHVMSEDAGGRIADWVDPEVELLDSAFFPLAYGSGVSINNNQFESVDSILFDVILPGTGTYYLEVSSAVPIGDGVTGDYELLVYTYPIPEPASLMLLTLSAVGLLRRRR